MKKREATANTKAEVSEDGEEYKPAIYLALQGNDWETNGYLLSVAIAEARAHDQKLYVVNQSGGPPDPPPCPNGFPNCRD